MCRTVTWRSCGAVQPSCTMETSSNRQLPIPVGKSCSRLASTAQVGFWEKWNKQVIKNEIQVIRYWAVWFNCSCWYTGGLGIENAQKHIKCMAQKLKISSWGAWHYIDTLLCMQAIEYDVLVATLITFMHKFGRYGPTLHWSLLHPQEAMVALLEWYEMQQNTW